jgi:hypothetical protein
LILSLSAQLQIPSLPAPVPAPVTPVDEAGAACFRSSVYVQKPVDKKCDQQNE